MKLGHWPTFIARWDSAKKKLVGTTWRIDLGCDPVAQLAFGFTYFFTQDVAKADASVPFEVSHDWDSRWVHKLQQVGHSVSVLQDHYKFLVIKVQHGDNISWPTESMIVPMQGSDQEQEKIIEILQESLPAEKDPPNAKCSFKRDYDILSGDYDIDKLPVVSSATCCAYCSFNARCSAFTFVESGEYLREGISMCYLKKTGGTFIPCKDGMKCISGVLQ